mmetsp:Transcript_7884/g.17178  ORF Transcript_7884/g.17178 Transcript_7884/m.17178 type:complete len:140 (-) Transcript_7884:251-670(-)|eukprot:CAMPEP_0173194436 /NCGR_PEP_ID=MMETSP1141-20130122/14509_1 /TAXON_ID=483371 /ORGANISM="non described non described, Strain CCMP2298" /LENGTH=139 /DNA_ID=CAMNT_0014118875 /DNA_START=40 /DNA_END=459 /DNA_ORIENTATION=+
MSTVVDLTDAVDSPVAPASPTRKRKLPDPLVGQEVWLVIHQKEAQEVGYGSRGNPYYNPDTFDASVVGIYSTRDKANLAAWDFCVDNSIGDRDYDDEEEEKEAREGEDFVGEGRFTDGSESGDVHTYSERVHVVMHRIQ